MITLKVTKPVVLEVGAIIPCGDKLYRIVEKYKGGWMYRIYENRNGRWVETSEYKHFETNSELKRLVWRANEQH